MSRKGRKHLPKVGTKPDNEHVYRQSQQDLVNFGRHRRIRSSTMRWVFIGIAIVAVAVLFIFMATT